MKSLTKLYVLIAIIAFIVGFLLPSLSRVKRYEDEIICAENMSNLVEAIRQYANDFDTYPTAEKWCDLLIECSSVKEEWFRCPGNKKEICCYAINPNAEPNYPSDMVLLFETKGGWNRYGGPEIMSLENHKKGLFKNKRKGCIIYFNDYHGQFIRAEEVNDLKWNVE
jgi:hypothetical protein